MKNLTVKAASRSIEVSKKFNSLASRYGTEEYKALQEVRRDYPGFKVVEVSTRKAPKSTYKGLTYDYMENYILSHDDGKNSVMNEYMSLRAMTVEAEEACAEACSYQEIKTWFLDKYPAIAAFHNARAKLVGDAQKKEQARKQKPDRKTLLQKKMEERRANIVALNA